MGKFIDLTGKKFGVLTVFKKAGISKNKKILWLCSCECGKDVIVIGAGLKNGSTKSCGCLKSEAISNAMTVHGQKKNGITSPEYTVWLNMKSRCYNLRNNRYDDWGGRGITVCDRWLNNFQNFLDDMGKRPSLKHSIDRFDNNKGYYLENCRWAIGIEQVLNRRVRSDNKSGYNGIVWNEISKKWKVYIYEINYGKQVNLGSYSDIEDAINARKKAEIKYYGKSS